MIFIKKQKFLELEKYEKITDDLPRQWYTCIELLSKKAVPLKMEFYGYWHRNLNAKKQDENAVQLMTIHKSKGLEWDNVFLIGLQVQP